MPPDDRREGKPAILLTGATGFIGSHLLRHVTPAYRVITLGRKPVEGIPHIPFDLAKSGALPVSRIPADYVLLHAAAAVRRSRQDDDDADRFRRINVDGTERLLRALERRLPAYILHISTADVYARAEDAISETSPVGPETPYAESKLEAESVVRDFGTSRHIPTCAARLGSIYGPGEEAFGKLVPTAIQAALSRQPVTVIGEGRARRDLLFVDDAARAIKALLSRQAAGVFNVVSGTPVSVMAVIQSIQSLAGSSAGVQFVDRSAAEHDRVFAPSALEAFGWAPETPLATGLKREIGSVLERRPMLAIDLDGTLLDHWTRMYGLYRDYLAAKQIAPLTFSSYKKQKRGGKSEAAIVAAALPEREVSAYLRWKRERIEDWSLLSTDTLSARSRAFLQALNRRFRVVLVTRRRRPRLLKRQLQGLGILDRFFQVIAAGGGEGPDGKVKALRELQRKSESPLWSIGDTEEDILAARLAGVRIAAVSWGLRSAGVLRAHKPDRVIRRAEW